MLANLHRFNISCLLMQITVDHESRSWQSWDVPINRISQDILQKLQSLWVCEILDSPETTADMALAKLKTALPNCIPVFFHVVFFTESSGLVCKLHAMLLLQELAGCYMFLPGILQWFSHSAARSQGRCRGRENRPVCRANADTFTSSTKYLSYQTLADCQLR